MKRNWLGYLAASVVLAGGVAYYMNQPEKSGKLGGKMEFDPGIAAVVGDENGRVCIDVKFKGTESEAQSIGYRFLYKYDFRTLTPKQKEAAIREGYEELMAGSGFACRDPGGDWFFRSAYAQPHCESPDCSGGCGTKACPGSIATGGGCTLGGINCVIIFICCGGPCSC